MPFILNANLIKVSKNKINAKFGDVQILIVTVCWHTTVSIQIWH